MAEQTVNVQCKIADIKPVPNSNAQIVSVHFQIGDREWFKGFRLNYDRPISMEEFQLELERVGIWPDEPEDFLAYVREVGDNPFLLKVKRPEQKIDAPIDPEAHN